MHSWWPPFPRCPPATMPFLPPLRLCRPWPRSPLTRPLGAAAGQRFGTFHRSSPSNYYELLGVHPSASTEEVKRAFFTKSKELHPDRDPGNPTLHSRFVELNEAYRVLSREQSRRSYDHQLRSASPLKSPENTAHPKSARQTHSSWAPPNAEYWAQFHAMRPQGPKSRQQQYKHNQRVLGYCLLLMLAGSWNRCTGASWTKRIRSSQPSTMTGGLRPGPIEPGSRRSNGRSSSSPQQPPPPGPPQDPGIMFLRSSPGWDLLCSLHTSFLGLPTNQNLQ
ncbi:dnaJ homolog subfamily C member 4 isoform X2 [Nycticebus coucang]|uniref:dnaJ homolog subfamily C member 4 isoform X2 n=1 Tax=Nycticebus coucang TaxID=9470 RepID=UPI00234C1810|nr:dnaJ homolog subfamily C member 4 isoform X2 [Nycticebus coucang]